VSYSQKYLKETSQIVARLEPSQIEKLARGIRLISQNHGRIFFLGVGGNAANASHAVNDFRKIAGIECYCPTDNVAELTARINDEGWDTVFSEWLKGSTLSKNDAVFVFSVGGGNREKNISLNIVTALKYAKKIGSKIFGIVGPEGGATAKMADCCIKIPTVNPRTITAHVESFQSTLWHLLVTHPDLKAHEMKWESIKRGKL